MSGSNPNTVGNVISETPEVLSENNGRLHDRIVGHIEAYEQWADQHPFMATTAESVAAFAAKRAVIWTGKKVGINFGNAHASQHIDGGEINPVAAAAQAIIVSPVVEELFFRKFLTGTLPESRLAKQHLGDKSQRICNIVSSIGFAFLGHGFDPINDRSQWQNPEKSLYARENITNSIAPIKGWNWAVPLGSVIGGEQYRRMYQKRGLGHAIFSHSLNNAMVIGWEGAHAARDFRVENPNTKLTARGIIKHIQAKRI